MPRPKNFQNENLRVQRAREAMQKPEYKEKQRAAIYARIKAGWKPNRNTEKARNAYRQLAEKRRGVHRNPAHTAKMLESNRLKTKPMPDPHLCACGCGRMVYPNCKKVLAKYLRGHAFRGTTASNHVGVAKRVAKLRGTHGHGRGERGRLDHTNALFWVIRDPLGKTYEFSNLAEWARRNTVLFHDYKPESRSPFWRRIAAGVSMMAGAKDPRGSYYGWILVSVKEAQDDSKDLMGRDEAEIVLP